MSLYSSNPNLLSNIAPYKDAFYLNLKLLEFESYTVKFTRDMFDNSNQSGFLEIMYFLFVKYDKTKSENLFRMYWPAYDKKQEKEFGQIAKQWLADIIKNEPEAMLGAIVPSFFVSPYGYKTYRFLAKFSCFVLKKVLMKKNPSLTILPHFGVKSVGDNSFLNGILDDEGHESALNDNESLRVNLVKDYDFFQKRGLALKKSLQINSSIYETKINTFKTQMIAKFGHVLSIQDMKNIIANYRILLKENLHKVVLLNMEDKLGYSLEKLSVDMANHINTLKAKKGTVLDGSKINISIPNSSSNEMKNNKNTPFLGDLLIEPPSSQDNSFCHNEDVLPRLNLLQLTTTFNKCFDTFWGTMNENRSKLNNSSATNLDLQKIGTIIDKSVRLRKRLKDACLATKSRVDKLQNLSGAEKISEDGNTFTLGMRDLFDAKLKRIGNPFDIAPTTRDGIVKNPENPIGFGLADLHPQLIDLTDEKSLNSRLDCYRSTLWACPDEDPIKMPSRLETIPSHPQFSGLNGIIHPILPRIPSISAKMSRIPVPKQVCIPARSKPRLEPLKSADVVGMTLLKERMNGPNDAASPVPETQIAAMPIKVTYNQGPVRVPRVPAVRPPTKVSRYSTTKRCDSARVSRKTTEYRKNDLNEVVSSGYGCFSKPSVLLKNSTLTNLEKSDDSAIHTIKSECNSGSIIDDKLTRISFSSPVERSQDSLDPTFHYSDPRDYNGNLDFTKVAALLTSPLMPFPLVPEVGRLPTIPDTSPTQASPEKLPLSSSSPLGSSDKLQSFRMNESNLTSQFELLCDVSMPDLTLNDD